MGPPVYGVKMANACEYVATTTVVVLRVNAIERIPIHTSTSMRTLADAGWMIMIAIMSAHTRTGQGKRLRSWVDGSMTPTNHHHAYDSNGNALHTHHLYTQAAIIITMIMIIDIDRSMSIVQCIN